MSAAKLPPPDMSGTDPDATLRSRISFGEPAPPPATPTPPPAAPVPRPYPGTGGYGQGAGNRTPARQQARGRKPAGGRPDPPGMTRESYYVSKEAAGALGRAVEQVLDVLGDGVSKHVALSALLMAGAAAAGDVAAQLASARAAELSARVEQLRHVGEDQG